MSHIVPAPPPWPFFDITYDVRAVIYEQFETDALPPLSKSTEYAGFALSFSEAKYEIEYVAVQRYKTFLDGFKKTFETRTGPAVQVLKPIASKTLRQMRELTIQLPTIALGVDQDMHGALHPLFSCFYDRLRLHFHAPNIPQPPSLTDDLREVLEDIADTIEHVNSPCVLQYVRPMKRVSCKAIVVCWDSRPTSEDGSDSSIEFKGKYTSASVSQRRLLGLPDSVMVVSGE
jgi:hypothetical protein